MEGLVAGEGGKQKLAVIQNQMRGSEKKAIRQILVGTAWLSNGMRETVPNRDYSHSRMIIRNKMSSISLVLAIVLAYY